MVMGLRVAFFGTPAFAVPTLDAIRASEHELAGIVTQPDRPRGRGQKLVAGPVKARAAEIGVPVLQPARMRDEEFLSAFRALRADIGVVAAYGRILPQSLLDTPRLGMINVHASLLPRWRGAAPIHRAILAGDTETGVTIMRVVQALDAGPTLSRVVVPIGPNETSAELELRLAAVGGPLLVEALDRLAAGPVAEQPQDETAVTYAERLERHESQIDWARPATDVHNRIRGLHPWPLAAVIVDGKRILLLRSEIVASPGAPAPPGTVISVGPSGIVVSARDGAVRVVQLQPEGRAPMAARDFLNGHPVRPGAQFMPLPAAP
jgi:methionyl-tRNA formyltransferase